MSWGAAIGGIAGGLLGGASDSGNPKNINKPWMKQNRRGLRFGVNEARDIYGTPQQYYPGETVAPLNPYQLSGANYLQGYAGSIQPYIDQTQQMSSFMQSPAMLDVANNPYVGGMADAMGNRLGRMLTRQALPAIRRGSSAAGQFGGSRGDIAKGLAIGDTQQAFGDAMANLYGGAYQSGLGAVNRAQSMAPQFTMLGTFPGQQMMGLGDMFRGYDQQLIDAARDRFDFYQTEPENRLDRYLNRQMGVAGLGGMTTSSGAGPSTLQRTLGGAMTGAALGRGVGNMFGASPFTFGSSGGGMSPAQWGAFGF